MRGVCLVVLMSMFAFALSAQDCEVKVEALSGSYEGKCRKGLAHGKGKAMGEDTYEGSWKKGYPDGNGVYTFANGNVYEGKFDKGMKAGEGVMKFATDDLPDLEGYWIDDEYAGKDKKVYDVIDRSTSIKTVRFRRISGDINQITFKFANQGKPVKATDITFECPNAVFVNGTDFEAVYSISEFPIKGNVRFRAAGLRTANGSSDYVSGQAEFEITFKGDWEVTIEMNNNE
ncbi:MORN repeat-containing protein [Portibacter marinus]|uniref:hypothetical protein n=1 Tax=Portibacter marinus TaxID=2898660 RepID=UPI001F1F271A|nr:hypothetical protein [Portibacter marinus]